MNEWIKILLYFIASVLLSLIVAPFVIKLMRKLKAGQTVLGYVKQHEAKNGTPTMGGIIFLLPAIVFPLIEFTAFSAVAVSAMVGFCVLGFLDDFLKVHFERNLGLKPYQKIIGQLGISVAVGYFVYASRFVGTTLDFPFGASLDINWGIIPFVVLVYVATTNSVNLTDGLDGLAGFTSVAYFITFSLILFFLWRDAALSGDAEYAKQLLSLTVYSVCLLGGLVGYLVFNSSPAKIWMGDTGSLALGAGVATVAVFAKISILIAVAGIMFVVSSISVIVQVLYFKLTKKRVFLMAPFHHHLEMKGLKEPQIVAIYFAVSMIFGAVTLIFARA